MTYSRK